jgi:hypothetical protein
MDIKQFQREHVQCPMCLSKFDPEPFASIADKNEKSWRDHTQRVLTDDRCCPTDLDKQIMFDYYNEQGQIFADAAALIRKGEVYKAGGRLEDLEDLNWCPDELWSFVGRP